MKYEFKVGDIVRCISNNPVDRYCKNKIGRIIETHLEWKHWYCVEFFEPLENGHNRYEFGRGKDGYCWNFYEYEIELYIPILKLFLKEKQNG